MSESVQSPAAMPTPPPSRERPTSQRVRRWARYGTAIIGGLLITIVGQGGSLLNLLSLSPVTLVVTAGPVASLVLTIEMCMNYMQNSRSSNAKEYCFYLIIVAGLFCYVLSADHHWEYHLPALAGLFFAFFVWEYAMFYHAHDLEVDERTEVWNGHRFVSAPSLVAVVLVFLFLRFIHGMDYDVSTWAVEGSKLSIFDQSGSSKDTNDAIFSAFSRGIISFHLIIVSFAFFVSTGRYDKIVHWIHSLVRPKSSD